jgi:hypothetical protein
MNTQNVLLKQMSNSNSSSKPSPSAMHRAGPGIVAVQGQGQEFAGAIVFWRIIGDLSIDNLTPAWLSRGLPLDWLPEMPTPARALSLAVQDEKEKRRLVRPLEGMRGWAIVDEDAVGEDLSYSIIARVYLEKDASLPEKHLTFDPKNSSCEDDIRESYSKHRTQLAGSDVSLWLCRMLDNVQSISLRDRGGVYFVPQYAMDAWERIVSAVCSVSGHKILCVPAAKTQDIAEAFLDALAQEADGEIQRIEEELAKGKLGARAISSRIEYAGEMEKKALAYENLFGLKLTAIHEKRKKLCAKLTLAMVNEEGGAGDELEEMDADYVK